MTLSELAALAAKVEGFERPVREACRDCNGELYVTEGQSYLPCFCKDSESPGLEPEDPAALLMAVAAWNYTKGRDLQTRSWLWGYNFIIRDGGGGRGLGELKDGTPESIARAALVALLRAHGVEVDCD